MYKLSNIKFHNICQYTDISIPVDLGLLAVCGRNGSGKTSLLRGLVYGLTGLVDGSWGTQQSLQKDGTVEPGYVEITLLSDTGEQLVIKRFSTSGVKFPDSVYSILGETRSVKAARRRDVDKYLATVYGISCQLLFQICWGRQGQMDTLLTAPASFINTFLASVFDTKYLEVVRDKIKMQLDTVAQLSGLCIEAARDAEEKLNSLQPIEDQQALVADLEASLTKETEKLSSLKTTVESGVDPVNWETLKQKTITKIKELEEYLASFADTEEPSAPSFSYDELKALCIDFTNRLTEYNTKYTIINAEYNAANSKLSELQEHLDLYISKYEENMAAIKKRDTICQVCKGEIVDFYSYEKEKCRLLTGFGSLDEFTRAYLEERSTHLLAIEDVKKQIEDKNTILSDILQNVKSTKEDLSKTEFLLEAADKHRSWLSDKEKKEDAQVTLNAAKIMLENLGAVTPLTEELLESYRQQEAIVASYKDKYSKALEDLVNLQSTKQYLTMTLEESSKMIQQYEINKEARSLLTCIRDVLSQTRAQARYLASKITELNSRIASLLERTDMPFSLQLNPDTHVFEYTTVEGFVHPAAHLSGAQKNISSVILQMAILSVIQPNINLFLVDEPSEALDNENKIVMADLFQRMNRMLPSIDGVMMIVSRDDQLISSCEHIINVNEV